MSIQRKLPVETPREWIRHTSENLDIAEREIEYRSPAYHTLFSLPKRG